MTERGPLRLFQAYGVELEYMIVDAGSLDVLPVADEVLRAVAGEFVSEVELGDVAWSNELVLHVIELKTNGPATSFDPLPAAFQRNVAKINDLLRPLGGLLMPSAVHPWMDPAREMRLWPHEYSPIYEAYHRIFNCRGHGWANLQSTHLNLPFGDDEEFGRLHAAVRLVLPLTPALAASSPIRDGRATGLADSRLDVYRTNAAIIPSITGRVVPEPVFSREDYRRRILQPMYDDIRPLDPEGVLQHEFLNSRGAIARFERAAIEVRTLDAQECPAADVALCVAVAAAVRAVVSERWSGQGRQRGLPTETLQGLLLDGMRRGDRALIRDRQYLDQFGFAGASCTAGELWAHVCEATGLLSSPASGAAPDWRRPLEVILRHGPLAGRILRALAGDHSPPRLRQVYRELCRCLAAGEPFVGEKSP